MREWKLGGVAAVVVAAATLVFIPSAGAVTFNVTSADGGTGPGTLGEAVVLSREEFNPGADEITFAGALNGSTITLTHEPFTDSPLTITGPGADLLTISGNNAHGIFWFDTAPGDDVTVSGLTLTDGERGAGGAILSVDPDLTLRDVALTGNTADSGNGGALSAQSTVNGAGSLTIERSEITENTATSPNSGVVGAGFAANAIGPVVVRNSTISDNMATSSGSGGQALGGGVFLDGGASIPSATFENSTIAGNSLTHATNNANGGGIQESISPPVVLRNTIVAGNTLSGSVEFTGGPDLFGFGNSFDAEFTLVGDDSDVVINETIAGSNILNQDPLLQALSDNGGPTRTQMLGATSPALDAGRSYCAASDQRGGAFGRPSDLPGPANSTAAGADGSDIGAYEEQGGVVSVPTLCVPLAPPSPPPTVFTPPSNTFSFGKLKRNKKKGIAFLIVNVPGPGEVSLAGKGVKNVGSAGASKSVATQGGRVKLRVKPGKGKRARKIVRKLKNKGKAGLKVRVTYVPTGGTANTKPRKLKLVRKRR